MKVEYEEKRCGVQEEKEGQACQRLDTFCKQPPVGLRRADISEENLSSERQEPELPSVKKEAFEPPGVKEEEELWCPNITKEEQLSPSVKEEDDFTELPVTLVHVKTEIEEGQYEEKKGEEPPSSISSRHMTTETDGEQGDGSQAGGWLAPMSDGDDTMSHTPHADDDDNNVVEWGDVCEEYFGPEQQEPDLPDIKEESEPPDVKDEERLLCPNIKKEEHLLPCMKEEGDFTELPLTGINLSIEGEESQNEGKKLCEPPSSSSSQHVTTEIDNEHVVGSRVDPWLAPMSDGDDTASHSSHTDGDDEAWEGEVTRHTDSKRWKCSHCRKTFEYKYCLQEHMLGHTGKKPFACSLCGKKFSTKQNLMIHVRSHTGEKPFECSVCGQRFSQQGALRPHLRTHSGETPFVCSFCGQRFSRKGNMIKHIRTHTGEKPFECSVCAQRFSQQGALGPHLRTHTGEKPFVCSFCGQRFTKKGNMNKHTRIHTGEKPFACAFCGERFSWKGNMIRHTKTHTSESHFDCSVCGERFPCQEKAKKHKCAEENK